MIRSEMGPVAGDIAGIGMLLICIIVLAVLALVVVNALMGSPWGTFTVFCTIPIALIMGVYSRFIRPGRIAEMSVIGAVLLLAALIYGRTVSETPALAAYFNLTGTTLALIIIGYGFVASVLPVWLLLAPRDYLSTFLKVGTILLLAIGVIIVHPDLQMPAVTRFIDGTGPVWAGSLFPFLFITIACGSVSGWHALIASGTTPKMIENESQIALHRLWRHADGIAGRHHGDDRRLGDPSGRVLRDEQLGRTDRHHAGPCRAGDLLVGLHGDPRYADADGA